MDILFTLLLSLFFRFVRVMELLFFIFPAREREGLKEKVGQQQAD